MIPEIIYSVVVPVYKNEASIPRLLEALQSLSEELGDGMEAVFVVDGSPDQSFSLLREKMHDLSFPVKLLAHSRNFGSFPAVRTGLQAARGKYFGVLAADLQEPPELLLDFFQNLENGECDVAIGTRTSRNDPLGARVSSSIFWGVYRRFVIPEMPKGGVDVFGCNKIFCEKLLSLEESRSSLIALIFWLGFRRKLVEYERQPRHEGVSAWSFRKKIDYMLDSIFSFTDYPISLLLRLGGIGSIVSFVMGLIVLVGRLTGTIHVQGYTAIMITVLFFGALNLFGLGLVGTYAWRGYENSKRRPLAVVTMELENEK